MKRKAILFLSLLLLSMSLSACGISSSAELPNDPPAGSETAEEELFTPTVTVADVDLREVDLDLLWNRDTTFAISPRGDAFFARQDGTVWNYTYGDGYACFDSSGQGETFEQPVHAFDIHPVRMAIEEHGGVLIDDQGSLWGWGAFSKENGSFDKIMDHVVDVQLSFYEALVLCEDGTLWAWLRNGIEPQLLAENVRACGYSTHPLLLKENGQLVMLELKLNHNETAIQTVAERPLMDDVYALDGSFIYTVDGTLYTLDENLAPVKRFIGAVQAVHSNEGIVILDANGAIWLQEGLTEPQRIAENVQKLITHSNLLYIRRSGALCLFRDGEESVLDTHVLEAAAGYMPNGVTHSIFYSKGDGLLWHKGLVGDAEMITDNLLLT